ncbi:hypothetical protein ABT330_25430 [Streptomyces sp. NPDC000658]|uniref:hypothetical protein n=1 Tax=Streptomyces sp. NPDC000658 TaxID=3154266 RepID=UPI003328D7B6
MVLDRYLIRPATLDDDAEAVRALLEPVDFMDAAMPEEIGDRMRTGWPCRPSTAPRPCCSPRNTRRARSSASPTRSPRWSG